MRFVIINKHELELGIEKESSEHGMTPEEAKKTAIDHLKERPDYYSAAEKAGLEEKINELRLKGMHDKIKKIQKRTGKKVYWFASAI